MKQFSNLISEIGYPSPLNPVEIPLELEKDTEIGGWKVPYTMLTTSQEDLFRSFGLWQSSNGLCKSGVNHASLNRWGQTANTMHPVLVGDQIDGQSVWRAVNNYNSSTRLWAVSVVWGVPPEPLKLEGKEYAYLQAVLKHVETQAEETQALLDDFFSKVVKSCLTPAGMAGGTLLTAAAEIAWEGIKAQYEQKMKQSLEEMEEKQWQNF